MCFSPQLITGKIQNPAKSNGPLSSAPGGLLDTEMQRAKSCEWEDNSTGPSWRASWKAGDVDGKKKEQREGAGLEATG